MAQNISILEGGTAQQFGQVNKLKIANSGGGTSLWIPEDEVNTKSLHVDSNGTYYASQDECYGYDEVSVNIIDECFGYDDDGNLWDVEVDDDDFLEEEKLPTYIEITVPADRLIFIDGEDIDTTGMEVTAYHADGSVYGIVEDYVIEPTKADITKVTENIAKYDGFNQYCSNGIPYKTSYCEGITEEVEGLDGKPIKLRSMYRIKSGNGKHTAWLSPYGQDSSWSGVIASDEPFYVEYRIFNRGGVWKPWSDDPNPSQSWTYQDKTVYYHRCGGSYSYYTPKYMETVPNIDPSRRIDDDDTFRRSVAWTMIYGVCEGGMQSVKVQWLRDDSEVLETEYQIKVLQNPIGNITPSDSGSGGSSGGSW